MVEVDVEKLKAAMVCPESKILWTFGYASLIWKPGFRYSQRVVGHIKGYNRRFYQGTTTHRGTPEWPGRVATILKDENDESVVWGVAYSVENKEEIVSALKHLAEREMITGGYHFDKVLFYPLDSTIDPIIMCVYVADPGNLQYLGSGGSIEAQAYQIAKSEGVCGKNSEYVNKVVHFMKTEVSEVDWQEYDPYLYDLDFHVRQFQNGIEPSEEVKRIVPILVKEVNEDKEFKEMVRRESA